MNGLTPQQAKLYHWLLYRIDEPEGPSFTEMMTFMGQASKGGIHRLVTSLLAKGLVTATPNMTRSLRAVRLNSLDGVSTAAMIAELKRRGEWPHGR